MTVDPDAMKPSPRVTLAVEEGAAAAIADFLTRVGCRTRQLSSTRLEASLPRAETEVEARRELEIYVRVWNAMQPRKLIRIL